jgi:hypothetical protein
LDDTKRRPFTSVSVRWLPSEKKSTKVWPDPKGPSCAPTLLLPGTPKAAISDSACATLV